MKKIIKEFGNGLCILETDEPVSMPRQCNKCGAVYGAGLVSKECWTRGCDGVIEWIS